MCLFIEGIQNKSIQTRSHATQEEEVLCGIHYSATSTSQLSDGFVLLHLQVYGLAPANVEWIRLLQELTTEVV